jgi:hypothetical protein
MDLNQWPILLHGQGYHRFVGMCSKVAPCHKTGCGLFTVATWVAREPLWRRVFKLLHSELTPVNLTADYWASAVAVLGVSRLQHH